MEVILEKNILLSIAIPFWIIYRGSRICTKKRIGIDCEYKREAVLCLFFAYLLCLTAVTFFPLKLNFRPVSNLESHINLVPIIDTMKKALMYNNRLNIQGRILSFWVKNMGGNIILFIPLGILIPVIWSQFMRAWKTVGIAFLISITIESLQLITLYMGNSYRAFDIDDIIMNCIGTLIGYCILKAMIKRRKRVYDNGEF
jgi:glycopeptide antibiotics resistance protein